MSNKSETAGLADEQKMNEKNMPSNNDLVTLDEGQLREAMGLLMENPDKVTEILLNMPKDKYESIKYKLFRKEFPDENSVVQFINSLYIKQQIRDIPNAAYQIIDFLLTTQHKMALFNTEFWNDGDVTLGEVKNRILDIINTVPSQGELWPIFKAQKSQESVELKKEFALNFGGLDKIEEKYKHLLNEKLSSGLTLQQHINKVRNWFNDLHGEDLGNWIKLFAYVKSVKEYSEKDGEASNFNEIGPGRYCFSIRKNNDFYVNFIRPDKKTGQFTTRAKNKFLKWLHDNQNTIEFPMIINGKVWNVPMRIYEYVENVSDKTIYFKVDTNILESEFRDYVSININEIDAIGEAWEKIAKQNLDFSKFSLNNFIDIPLKFLLTLKNIYSREGNYTNGNFAGNVQHLKKEHLDEHLGGLSERVTKHLTIRHVIRSGKTSEMPLTIKRLILETTWNIAVQRGWLISKPTYNTETGMYKFNMNAGYFDRQATAKRLKAPQNS